MFISRNPIPFRHIFTQAVFFRSQTSRKKKRCENRVVCGQWRSKLIKQAIFCDSHILWIAMLSAMQRFYAKYGIENQSNSVFFEKSHFSRFHLQVYGLKQCGMKVLS